MNSKYKNAIWLILLLGFLRFVFMPWLNWSNGTTDYIQVQKSAVNRMLNLQNRQEQLSTQQFSLQAAHEQLAALWFDGRTQNAALELIKRLEPIAERHNVQMSSRNLGNVSSGIPSTVSVSVFVQAPPYNLQKFLAEIENAQPRAFISNSRLVKASVAASTISGNIDIIFAVKPANEGGAP